MKRRIAGELWGQIKTAYASGIGSRELARNMELPAGTVLARAKREGWTQQIVAAKLIERPYFEQVPLNHSCLEFLGIGEKYSRNHPDVCLPNQPSEATERRSVRDVHAREILSGCSFDELARNWLSWD
jgi:hypothetical protein